MTRLQEFSLPGWIPPIQSRTGLRELYNDFLVEYQIVTGHISMRAVRAALAELKAPASAHEPSVADRIGSIRHLLSLSMTDFARVAGIERPHAYAWVDGRSTPRPANMQRLEQLESVANRWKQLAGRTIGRLLHERLAGEPSALIDLLSAEELDEERIAALLPRLALRGREREAMSIKARLAAAGLPDISKERQARNLRYNLDRFSRGR